MNTPASEHGRAAPQADPRANSRQGADPRFEDLLPTVYEELHKLAGSLLHRNRAINSTRTTSLIQDVYVRLAGRDLRFKDHAHFLCLAARAMRMVLVDHARRVGAAKRGGSRVILTFDDAVAPAPDAPDLLGVEEALTRLAGFDERKSRIVELRFFGGLSVEETAGALGVSAATVKREWTLARAWLSREIGQFAAGPEEK
jgi:RNA polymerase sigma-70 factor, ECF subfamily